jgi:translation initiation factor 4A
VKCHACIGGTLIRDDVERLKDGQQLIVGTPGRVSDMIHKRFLRVREKTSSELMKVNTS